MRQIAPQNPSNSGNSNSQAGHNLADLRHFFLDLDGTLYLGPRVIAGSPEFVEYLRATGRKHLFFTNNSSKNAAEYAQKLATLGIPAAPEEVLTSGEAAIQFLLTSTPYRRVYALGVPSFEADLRSAGFDVCTDAAEAVLLAFDRTLTYQKLENAALLLRAGLPYFATNPDKVCPTEYGYIPDCGSMAALLKEATGRLPEFIGKPSAVMIRMGMLKIGASAATSVMVGDRLYTDMQMAYNAGISSVLVLSGEARAEDVPGVGQRPDWVLPSVQELHHALREADGQ